jgi:hypothetical protein
LGNNKRNLHGIFNVEMMMLTVFYSLYTFSATLWYSFLSLYLGSFLTAEDVGLKTFKNSSP